MCWKQTSNSCPDPNKAAAAAATMSGGSRLGSSLKHLSSGPIRITNLVIYSVISRFVQNQILLLEPLDDKSFT